MIKILIRRAGENGECFPGRDDFISNGIPKDTVPKVKRRLRSKGFIRWIPPGKEYGNPRRSCSYYFVFNGFWTKHMHEEHVAQVSKAKKAASGLGSEYPTGVLEAVELISSGKRYSGKWKKSLLYGSQIDMQSLSKQYKAALGLTNEEWDRLIEQELQKGSFF